MYVNFLPFTLLVIPDHSDDLWLKMNFSEPKQHFGGSHFP